jgi:hypothetical protein
MHSSATIRNTIGVLIMLASSGFGAFWLLHAALEDPNAALTYMVSDAKPTERGATMTVVGERGLLDRIESRLAPFLPRAASAANFYSDLRTSSTGILKIGATYGEWASLNATMFFTGANTGIDSASFSPRARLHVKSGNVYLDTAGTGVILTAPNGTCWRAFAGWNTSTAQAVACP